MNDARDTTSAAAVERQSLFEKFDGWGEARVRDILAQGQMNERRSALAREWLALRDSYPDARRADESLKTAKDANRISLAALAVAVIAMVIAAVALANGQG